MICPNCNMQDRVTRTILDKEANVIKRSRRCPKCGYTVETEERPAIVDPPAVATKKSAPSKKKREGADPETPVDERPDKPKGALAQAMSLQDD